MILGLMRDEMVLIPGAILGTLLLAGWVIMDYDTGTDAELLGDDTGTDAGSWPGWCWECIGVMLSDVRVRFLELCRGASTEEVLTSMWTALGDAQSRELPWVLLLAPPSILSPCCRYECEQCGRRFVRRNDLKVHEGTHRTREHECSVCGQGFARRTELQKHCQRKHPDEDEDYL